MRAAGHNVPLISALLYHLLVYIVYFPTYFFLHFFITYLLPYLSFPLRIDLIRFQAGCRKKRLNLAFVFFCVVVHFFDW